jgi:hypothetical protein
MQFTPRTEKELAESARLDTGPAAAQRRIKAR